MNEELVISKRVSGASNKLLLRAQHRKEKRTQSIQKLLTDPRIVQITSQDVTVTNKKSSYLLLMCDLREKQMLPI